MTDAPKPIEQIALQRLIENAYETFDKSLLSVGGRIVLWGSFANDKELAEQYFSSKGKVHLLDRRRRLSSVDSDFKEGIEWAATEAFEYIKWARDLGGQPILYESIVTYCAAFENCLKTIAVAFLLAEVDGRGDLSKQIYVPGPELAKARSLINKAWDRSSQHDVPRVRGFFENEIQAKNPVKAPFKFEEVSETDWSICASAFKLRNAILHSMGRPSEQIQLAEDIFHPGWDIELNARNLRTVKSSLLTALAPFGPWADL